MAALSGNRNTVERSNNLFNFPVAASTKIYQGSLVCINSSGLAVPAATSTTLKCVGRAEQLADNSAGLASAITIQVKRGCFKFANSAAADLIALKDIGSNAYLVDDQTVALTNGTNSRSVAGIIRDVDSDGGVWIEI
jgi:hypothetical protein